MIQPNQITKVALAVIGASTAIGTGFGIHSALQDKTIGDAIIRKGKKLINNKDIFEVAFKQHREEQTFLILISTQGNTIQKATNLKEGGIALTNWCTKNLKLGLTEENIQKVLPNAEKYCSLPPLMTMKQKLNKLRKKLATNWKERLEAIENWKTDEELAKILVTMNQTVTSVDKEKYPQIWINALDHWCNDKVNFQLIHDKEDGIFNTMNKYCFEITKK